MATGRLQTLPRYVSVGELRETIECYAVEPLLRSITVFSTKFAAGGFEDDRPRVNWYNLSLLAKAAVVWGNAGGGDGCDAGAVRDLLVIINSLQPLPIDGELGIEDAAARLLIPRAFQRYVSDDPLTARVGRVWLMYHELAAEGGLPVPDPSEELRGVLGVSAQELWTVGFMIHTFHITATARGGGWLFRPDDFVQDRDRAAFWNGVTSSVLDRIALTVPEIRARYVGNAKYGAETETAGGWQNAFNILRDFPVVRLRGGCCAPFPPFALTRATDGFYHDLLNEFVRRAKAAGRCGKGYDNEMSGTAGKLFERYVGLQLGHLPAGEGELRGEFEYGPKKSRRDSTDWILSRGGRTPVLFECKAREPNLDLQRDGMTDAYRREVAMGIGKACGQMAKFIQAIDEGLPGLEAYAGRDRFVCVPVLQVPLPFHMLPGLRAIIEEEATKRGPAWAAVRSRVDLVPLSARDLETLVASELADGIPIERSLKEYAEYREGAAAVERWEDGLPQFPDHLEEYLQIRRPGGPAALPNPPLSATFQHFCTACQTAIFGDDGEAEWHATVQRLAHQLWRERGCPLWDAERDWQAVERLLIGSSCPEPAAT